MKTIQSGVELIDIAVVGGTGNVLDNLIIPFLDDNNKTHATCLKSVDLVFMPNSYTSGITSGGFGEIHLNVGNEKLVDISTIDENSFYHYAAITPVSVANSMASLLFKEFGFYTQVDVDKKGNFLYRDTNININYKKFGVCNGRIIGTIEWERVDLTVSEAFELFG